MRTTNPRGAAIAAASTTGSREQKGVERVELVFEESGKDAPVDNAVATTGDGSGNGDEEVDGEDDGASMTAPREDALN